MSNTFFNFSNEEEKFYLTSQRISATKSYAFKKG